VVQAEMLAVKAMELMLVVMLRREGRYRRMRESWEIRKSQRGDW
jgi:hypothetical protein